jgi:thymidine kinase
MFIEPKNSKGWLEVVCGSMFSGKTEELIRRVKRARIAKQSVRIFKPKMETRYDKVKVVSHDDGLPEVCNTLANAGKRVVIAGLDMDYLAKPFGVMPNLMALAEYVTKVHAICMQCGSVAQYSYRFSKKGGRVQLGEKDQYEPRCRACFIKGMATQTAGRRR